MKLFFSALACLVMLIVLSSPAFAADEKAGWTIPIGLIYTTSTDNNASSTTTTTTDLILDPAVGYRFGNGFYVGASYFYSSLSQTAGSTTTATTTWYAPEVGYMAKGWNIRAGYVPTTASDKISSAVNISYDQGSGFYVDLGYEFMLSSSIGLGPQLKYYSLSYSKQTVAGTQTTLTTNENQTNLTPEILVAIHF